jgi:hypothetical protein
MSLLILQISQPRGEPVMQQNAASRVACPLHRYILSKHQSCSCVENGLSLLFRKAMWS